MIQTGLDRIGKEQDFIRFMKLQMMLVGAFKVLFTRNERFLLKNQSRFILRKTEGECSNKDIESEFTDAEETPHPENS